MMFRVHRLYHWTNEVERQCHRNRPFVTKQLNWSPCLLLNPIIPPETTHQFIYLFEITSTNDASFVELCRSSPFLCSKKMYGESDAILYGRSRSRGGSTAELRWQAVMWMKYTRTCSHPCWNTQFNFFSQSDDTWNRIRIDTYPPITTHPHTYSPLPKH